MLNIAASNTLGNPRGPKAYASTRKFAQTHIFALILFSYVAVAIGRTSRCIFPSAKVWCVAEYSGRWCVTEDDEILFSVVILTFFFGFVLQE